MAQPLASSGGTTPLVSVVIATHNYARFLPQCLESVRAQTFRDWECLIIDDASTDDTPAIAAAACRADPRFRYLRNEPNRGEAGSRNRGNSEARGTWLAALDADDWWREDRLERQLVAVKNNPAVVLVFSGKVDVSAEGERQVGCPPKWLERLPFTLRQESLIVHSSTLLRRDAWQAVGRYDEQIPTAPDWELWLRLLDHYGEGSFRYVDEPLVYYRLHGSNISRNWARMQRAEWQIIRRYLSRGGWGLRHPRGAVQAIDEQLWREIRRHEERGEQPAAFRLALLRAALTPLRPWRWQMAFQHRPRPQSAHTDPAPRVSTGD